MERCPRRRYRDLRFGGLPRPVSAGGHAMTSSSDSGHSVTVLISGGFELAYRRCLPEFQNDTGIAVETLSGASQGQGPKTIRHQLDHGAQVDVVILSNEGLEELRQAGLIAGDPALELATAPLAAAVRAGAPRPDVSSVAALTRTLSDARLVVMPGSTSGLFILHTVLPKLGIAGTVRKRVIPAAPNPPPPWRLETPTSRWGRSANWSTSPASSRSGLCRTRCNSSKPSPQPLSRR